MLTRRDFLKRSTLIALTPAVPLFLARTARASRPERDARALVVLQLDGGNDGINTVVPFKDEGYAKHRTVLRLPQDQLLKVTADLGLHPSLDGFAKLLEDGRLATIQGVGYPNPDRSHARSMAIWETARLDPDEHKDLGWLGRAFDGAPPPQYKGAPASVFLGSNSVPLALHSRQAVASALADVEDFATTLDGAARKAAAGPKPKDDLTAFARRSLLDGYDTADWLKEARAPDSGASYPATALASHLKLIARLIKGGLGARVYYTSQGSYDTHATQLLVHAGLLAELGGAVRAFLDDLAAAKLADRVAVLAFSEFGRRVQENGSGTDHGTAGPVFLAGGAVKGGFVGKTPSLTDLVDGDLKAGTDFRRVYATVLEDWLGLASKPVLGAEWERLPLFRG